MSMSSASKTSLFARTASSRKTNPNSYSYDSKVAILKKIQEHYSSFNKSTESKNLQTKINHALFKSGDSSFFNEEHSLFPSSNKKPIESKSKEATVDECFESLTEYMNNDNNKNKTLFRTAKEVITLFDAEPSEFSYSETIIQAFCSSIPFAIVFASASMGLSGPAAPIVAPCVFVGTILAKVTYDTICAFCDNQAGIKRTSEYHAVETLSKFKNLDENSAIFKQKMTRIAEEYDKLSEKHTGSMGWLFNKQENELLTRIRNNSTRIKNDLTEYLCKKNLHGSYGTVLFQAIHTVLEDNTSVAEII